ncbi:MAG: hypothetical protein AAGG38_04845 [Planctomycetota bacterium]
MPEMKLDHDQLDKILSHFGQQPSSRFDQFLDRAAKILPFLTVLVLGVWTLFLYSAFVREHHDLTNQQLSAELRSTDIERQTLENKSTIQEIEIDLASRRKLRRNATLESESIGSSNGQILYRIVYTMTLSNLSRIRSSVTYNMVVPYHGVLELPAEESFWQVFPPPWIGMDSPDKSVVQWKQMGMVFNITESAKSKYLTRIETKYDPKTVGLSGTGDIEPGETMTFSYTFYLKGTKNDWFGVLFHARLNDSDDDGDNWTHIEWNPLHAPQNKEQDSQPLQLTGCARER